MAKRLVNRRRSRNLQSAFANRSVLQKNLPELSRFNDLYYWLLTSGRLVFGATILAVYLGVNALFAFAYLLCGGVENARPGSFLDAFFFSVQTMATIGYGRMVPISVVANSLVTIEAGLGLFGMAVAASLMFARFTRATAGVRFATVAVVSQFDGKPTLMIRVANERVVRINEAHIYLVLARQQKSAEGHEYRRLYDLQPVRSFSPVFELSWTVMHVIDEASPLWGCDADEIVDSDMAITVVFSGHHDGFQQPVHARHTYSAEQVLWDHRFADLIHRNPQGETVIDYACFDKVVKS